MYIMLIINNLQEGPNVAYAFPATAPHPGKHQHGASGNWTAQTYNVDHRQESNPATFIQPVQGHT